MANIDAFNIRIDTSQLEKYKRELDAATASGKNAASASANYASELNKVSRALADGEAIQRRYSQAVRQGTQADIQIAIEQQQNFAKGLRATGLAASEAGELFKKHAANISILGREIRSITDEILAGRLRQGIGSIFIAITQGAGVAIPQLAALAAVLAVPAFVFISWMRWRSAVEEGTATLKTFGAAAGLSFGQLEEMAEAASKAGLRSTATYRELGLQLAKAGVAGKEYATLFSTFDQYLRATGKDAEKAGEELGKAFANPAKSLKELAEQTGRVSISQLRMAENAETVGDKQKAISILAEAQTAVMREQTKETNYLSMAWYGLGRAISNTMDTIGRAFDIEQPLQASQRLGRELDELKRKLDELKKGTGSGYARETGEAPGLEGPTTAPGETAEQIKAQIRLKEEQKRAADVAVVAERAFAEARQKGVEQTRVLLKAEEDLKRILPFEMKIKDLDLLITTYQKAVEIMRDAVEEEKAWGLAIKEDEEVLKDYEKALERANQQRKYALSDADKMIQRTMDEIRVLQLAVSAREEERAAIQAQRTAEERGDSENQIRDEKIAARAGVRAKQQTEYQDRLNSIRQETELLRQMNTSMDNFGGAATEARLQMEALQEATKNAAVNAQELYEALSMRDFQVQLGGILDKIQNISREAQAMARQPGGFPIPGGGLTIPRIPLNMQPLPQMMTYGGAVQAQGQPGGPPTVLGPYGLQPITGFETSRATYAPLGTSPATLQERAQLAALRQRESGGRYGALYGQEGEPIKDFSHFPDWPGAMGPQGISHAAGAYQMQPGTYAEAARALGIASFTPEDQDRAALWVLRHHPDAWAASAPVGGSPGTAIAQTVAMAPVGERYVNPQMMQEFTERAKQAEEILKNIGLNQVTINKAVADADKQLASFLGNLERKPGITQKEIDSAKQLVTIYAAANAQIRLEQAGQAVAARLEQENEQVEVLKLQLSTLSDYTEKQKLAVQLEKDKAYFMKLGLEGMPLERAMRDITPVETEKVDLENKLAIAQKQIAEYKQLADAIAGSIGNAFDKAIEGGTMFRDIMKDLGKDIAKIGVQEFITDPLKRALEALIGAPGVAGYGQGSGLMGAMGLTVGGGTSGGTGGGGGGTGTGGLMGVAGSLIARGISTLPGGQTSSNTTINVSGLTPDVAAGVTPGFASTILSAPASGGMTVTGRETVPLPNFQVGGAVERFFTGADRGGLRSGEVPAVLHEDEFVLTKAEASTADQLFGKGGIKNFLGGMKGKRYFHGGDVVPSYQEGGFVNSLLNVFGFGTVSGLSAGELPGEQWDRSGSYPTLTPDARVRQPLGFENIDISDPVTSARRGGSGLRSIFEDPLMSVGTRLPINALEDPLMSVGTRLPINALEDPLMSVGTTLPGRGGTARPSYSYLEELTNAAARGMTFGGSDYAAAAGAATGGFLRGQGFAATFSQALAQRQARAAVFGQTHPYMETLAQLLGSFSLVKTARPMIYYSPPAGVPMSLNPAIQVPPGGFARPGPAINVPPGGFQTPGAYNFGGGHGPIFPETLIKPYENLPALTNIPAYQEGGSVWDPAAQILPKQTGIFGGMFGNLSMRDVLIPLALAAAGAGAGFFFGGRRTKTATFQGRSFQLGAPFQGSLGMGLAAGAGGLALGSLGAGLIDKIWGEPKPDSSLRDSQKVPWWDQLFGGPNTLIGGMLWKPKSFQEGGEVSESTVDQITQQVVANVASYQRDEQRAAATADVMGSSSQQLLSGTNISGEVRSGGFGAEAVPGGPPPPHYMRDILIQGLQKIGGAALGQFMGGSGGGGGNFLSGLFSGGSSAPSMATGQIGLGTPFDTDLALGKPTLGSYQFGGSVTLPSYRKLVDPGVFRGAARYQMGGVAGLEPGEVPIITHVGERIASYQAGGPVTGGGTTSNTHHTNIAVNVYTPDAQSFRSSESQIKQTMANAQEYARSRNE